MSVNVVRNASAAASAGMSSHSRRRAYSSLTCGCVCWSCANAPRTSVATGVPPGRRWASTRASASGRAAIRVAPTFRRTTASTGVSAAWTTFTTGHRATRPPSTSSVSANRLAGSSSSAGNDRSISGVPTRAASSSSASCCNRTSRCARPGRSWAVNHPATDRSCCRTASCRPCRTCSSLFCCDRSDRNCGRSNAPGCTALSMYTRGGGVISSVRPTRSAKSARRSSTAAGSPPLMRSSWSALFRQNRKFAAAFPAATVASSCCGWRSAYFSTLCTQSGKSMCRSIRRVTSTCDAQWLSMSGRSSITCRASVATSWVTSRNCPGTSRSRRAETAAAREAWA